LSVITALRADALPSEPADGALEEGGGRCGALVLERFDVRQATVVVHTDVQIVPALVAAMGAASALEAVTDLAEAAELLGVEVQQLTRPLPFVADDGGLGRQARETLESTALEHRGDGRARHRQARRDLCGGPSSSA
jgi:hypothetical protein